jgi:hypothetical protein
VIAGVYVGALRRERRRPAVVPADPGGCVGAEIGAEPVVAPQAAPAAARGA